MLCVWYVPLAFDEDVGVESKIYDRPHLNGEREDCNLLRTAVGSPF